MKKNNYQITGIKGRLLHISLVACYLLIVLLYACEDGYQPTKRISLDNDTLEIKEGEEATLNLIVVKSSKMPDTYTVKEWKSDKTSIATVVLKTEETEEEDGEDPPDEITEVFVQSSIIIPFTVTATGKKDDKTAITIKVIKNGTPAGGTPETETFRCEVTVIK